MKSCAKKCRPGDVIRLKGSSDKFQVQSNYIDELYSGYDYLGPGYINVFSLEANSRTVLLGPDMDRIFKITKSKK